MDLLTSNRIVVLALLLICGAMLVTPVLGGTPLEIVSWGDDDYGQVSSTPAGTGCTAVAAGGSHSLALRADGTIAAWGDDRRGQVSGTPAGAGHTAIAAGYDHSLALRADGSIAAWGSDVRHVVSQAPPGTGHRAAASGVYHGVALRADGSIASWGDDSYGQISQTPTGTGFVAVAAGAYHSVALRADGSIVSWGIDDGVLEDYGLVSETPSGTGFTAIAAGSTHSLALRADGSIAAWGNDDGNLQDYGQVSDTPTDAGYVAIAAGSFHSLALRADGSIASWGDDRDGQVSQAPAGSGFVAVAGGGAHSLALRADDPGIAPFAAFTANTTLGFAPLAVQFSDTSIGAVDSREWAFGDGANSTEQNPVHVYTVAGSYTVTLAVANANGATSATRAVTVVDPAAPVASFTANTTSGRAPLAVQFTDTSGGVVASRLWEFGDGANSTERNPVHVYTVAGTHTATLAVGGPAGSDSTNRTVTVLLPGSPALEIQARVMSPSGAWPVAGSWYIPDIGVGQVACEFTVTNTGDVPLTDCLITGGVRLNLVQRLEPGTSTYAVALEPWREGVNTCHGFVYGYYGTEGVFNATEAQYFGAAPAIAIEARANGEDADAAPGPGVGVGDPVAWTYVVTNTGNVDLSGITVTDDTGVAVTAPATALAPGETMTATATGTAVAGPHANNGTVTGTPPGGLPAVTATDPSHYLGIGLPTAGFTANVTRGPAPLAVAFTDASSGTVGSRSWTFGDGGTSTETDPTHVYTAAGTYTVNLTVTGAAGTDTETKPGLITVSPAVLSVPPSVLLPTDLNSDGKYEDVNGNGAKDFNDIVLFFNQLKWIIANEPVGAFDYNGNGRIDFADVVWLFNNL